MWWFLQKIFSRQRRRVGIWLLFVLTVNRGFALDPQKSIFQFNCQNWTRQTGLPANKISSITQSSDGYLWLGTQNGLVRFDGYEFKSVRIDLPMARRQDIRSLAPNKDGGILFAVNRGHFVSYDGEKFSLLGDDRWQQQNLNPNVILAARDGTIWTGSDLGAGHWLDQNPAASWFGEVTNGIVLSLCEDTSGRIWQGTVERGLYYWADGKMVQVDNDYLKKSVIFALAADHENQIWVGTSFGLRCYANGQLKETAPFACEVKALLVDRHGVLWIATTGQGLARYENGQFSFLKKADGLGSDDVTALFEDAEGSLWVGTRDGLSQLTDVKFPIFSSNEGIAGGSGHSVFASRKGGLWISTSMGISYLNGSNIVNYTTASTLSNPYVKRIFEARNGDVYIVDGDKNISVLSGDHISARYTNSNWSVAFAEDDKSVLVAVSDSLKRIENGQLRSFQYQGGTPPTYYWINNLRVAKDGAIWVASNNGVFRIKDGVTQHWGLEEGLASLTIQWIFEDVDGSIWIGSDAGLARLKADQIKTIKEENGLADNRIFAIVPDDFGFFWVTSGKGIFRTSRQNLNDFADGKIARVQCELFDGLESVKFNDQTDQEFSGCKTSDGRIWFPNPQGVVMIDPGHFFTNAVAPPVHIQQITVNGTELKGREHLMLPNEASRVEFFFSALSYLAPRKTVVRYRLEGLDPDWINAGANRSVLYRKLPPGKYKFHVQAANADGVWNLAGSNFSFEVPPAYYQTIWFKGFCGGAVLFILFGSYWLTVRTMEMRQKKLQAQNDLLEQKVGQRTAELGKVNVSLQHEIEEHKATELQLESKTRSLEAEIEERERVQAEVEKIHRELMEASRMAGKAEVAIGVLHNVGNVLNSVNVSATLLTEQVENFKVGSVSRVAALLTERVATANGFLAHDPQLQRIPGFLTELATHLATEQMSALTELAALQKNVEHIKDIVSMQQTYAKVAGVTQAIQVSELIEDSLRLNENALIRHHIRVLREYDSPLPEIVVDKHKAMQILINLMSNAKYACDETQRGDKQMIVRVHAEARQIRIAVADNGIGIPPENLNRIFNHGFTTRERGHGFGLHSGALAAKEMGGSLTVQSDGIGCGAIFTLALPLQPPTEK